MRHLTLVPNESIVIPVNDLLISDPLTWACSIPASGPKVAPTMPTGDVPQPTPLEGWRFVVTPYIQGYIVAARKGSLVIRKDKMSADQVREYVPR